MNLTTEEVLGVIKRHIRSKGYAPTVREIGDEVGLKSPAAVHHHLEVLRREGHIDWEPGKSRTLRVIK